jgi:hypothetical protein
LKVALNTITLYQTRIKFKRNAYSRNHVEKLSEGHLLNEINI